MIIGFKEMRLIYKLIENKTEATGFEAYQFYWPFRSMKNLETKFVKTDDDESIFNKIYRLKKLLWILNIPLILFFGLLILSVIFKK